MQLDRGDLAGAGPGGGEAAGPRAAAGPYERRLPDGRTMEVRSSTLPDGRSIRTYTDVTERHAALAAQEAARAALAAAFENAPLGIALVDADGRVEVANSLTGALLDLPPELMRPGTEIRDILQAQLARGDFAATPEAVPLADRQPARAARRSTRPMSAPRCDGRMMEVRVRFLEDGRSVRTFTDVTGAGMRAAGAGGGAAGGRGGMRGRAPNSSPWSATSCAPR